VEHAKDRNAVAVNTILEHIGRVEDSQYDLPILLAAGNRPPEQGMVGQKSGLGDDFTRYDRRERWVARLKELGKAIEVGERCGRPFDFRRLCQGLNAGVPQVSSQRTTSSCGTVGSPVSIAAQRRSSSAISSGSTVIGPLSAAMSERSCATLTPRSAARAFNASAVTSSTSMVWVFEDMPQSKADSSYCREALSDQLDSFAGVTTEARDVNNRQ
jgi:hypothetical protein